MLHDRSQAVRPRRGYHAGMRSPHVLISGASIAGPALAHWLNAAGWTTTVVERFDALRDTGHNVDVRGAAREVVRRMGLDDAVRGATTGETGTAFVDERGDVVADFPAGRSDTGGATAEVEILRGELARLLNEGTRDDTEYVFGDRITALHDRPDGVSVGFERSADRTFDLVVIAEGLTSRTRALAFPDARTTDLGLYLAYLTIPRTPADDDRWRWYNAPGGPPGLAAAGQRRHDPRHPGLPLRRPRPRGARPPRPGADPPADLPGRGLGDRAGAGRARRALLLRRRRPGPAAPVDQRSGGAGRGRRLVRVAAQRHGDQPRPRRCLRPRRRAHHPRRPPRGLRPLSRPRCGPTSTARRSCHRERRASRSRGPAPGVTALRTALRVAGSPVGRRAGSGCSLPPADEIDLPRYASLPGREGQARAARA